MSTTYTNPVNRGDHPDPSVIRVGKTFWAATTSTDWAPCFPLLRSNDLVNWSTVGAVFPQPPAWSDGDYWAPELSQHGGRYYVYYVGRRREGPLTIAVASADAPEGPYVDHGPIVGQASGSIDPMAVEDSRGVRHLIWKEDGNSIGMPTVLWIQRLSDDGTRLVGEATEILRNDAPWEDAVIEAPFVLRRDGWYYLFYSGNSCCGTGCRYAVGCARARDLYGPWEKCPRNPIMASNSAWRCPGHGSIAQLDDGRTYMLYHAYAAEVTDPRGIGRQTLLDEVAWETDGWPSINGGGGPSTIAASPLGTRLRAPLPHYTADFSATHLDSEWQWPHDGSPVVALAGGKLTLAPGGVGEPSDPIAAVIGRRTLELDTIATATVDVASLAPGTHAGLSAYGNAGNALGVAYHDREIVVFRRRRGRHAIVARTPAPPCDSIAFRLIVTDGKHYRTSYNAGNGWQELGPEFDGSYLPPWDAGVRLALVAGGEAARASFSAFRIEPFVPNVRFLSPETENREEVALRRFA